MAFLRLSVIALPLVLVLIISCMHTTRAFALLGRRFVAKPQPRRFLWGALASSSMALRSVATSTRGGSMDDAVCAANNNPLLQSWASQPLRLPPFAEIQTHHFKPALEEGMKLELQDVQNIVDNPDPPTFENVIAAFDRAGSVYDKVSSVYGNYCGSLITEDLQEVQTEMSPIMSRHASQCTTLPGLFEKIDAVYQQRHDMKLNSEQLRLVERVHLDFVRAGATLSEADKQEYADLNAELASLTTQFTQNILKDEESYEMVLKLEDMEGCPDGLIQSARQAAMERNKAEDEYVVTLGRSLVEPFLTYSARRDLRKQAFEAWTKRGELDPERDNPGIAIKILRLRKRMAEIHGYKSFAEYQCVDRMAKTPEKVMELLTNVWDLAKQSAKREREDLEQFVQSSGETLEGGVQGWDWRYYAEKVRQDKYDFDESLLKPYLSLEKVTEALFAVSGKLYGLKYFPRDDIQAYHPDVKVYEVREDQEDGTEKLTAVFIHDNFARKGKNGGAWMSEYRSQTRNLVPSDEKDAYLEGIPIVSNNNNFAKGENTLLSYDDATTCFHEAGHGHHGMLSNATYSRLASTNVVTDFVELPSQLMESWFDSREVLQKYARHYETGESVPDDLVDKLMNARMFNQGFATIEYTACALFDMLVHQLEDYPDDFDLSAFEKSELEKLGMPQGIVMRHRPPHFMHLFSTNMYAAGYYVYLWAEVLDADAFAAFKEAGNIFDEETAAKARKYIYSAGNTVAPDELFRLFRGRDPDIKFMLEKRGLIAKE
ncbi:Oligopeptidase A [Seminavis robusta]|uniref:Oligopeptidase A n=1 Tax=Seminavis robusta TaxID=568900 RepID=A0A9N8DHH6_9STRA|nr:Oligopeptidase A [Seminavis robusta]|eukprot:Sro155_g070570.1 Oligopeptidase A (771) ;mRNA; f:98573-100885